MSLVGVLKCEFSYSFFKSACSSWLTLLIRTVGCILMARLCLVFSFSFVFLVSVCYEKRLSAVCCIHYEPLSQADDKKRRCNGVGNEVATMRFPLVTNAPYLMPCCCFASYFSGCCSLRRQ